MIFKNILNKILDLNSKDKILDYSEDYSEEYFNCKVRSKIIKII